jgi:hypothetical protein
VRLFCSWLALRAVIDAGWVGGVVAMSAVLRSRAAAMACEGWRRGATIGVSGGLVPHC